MIKVKLLSSTVDPTKLIAMAARVCYTNMDIEELAESLTPEKSLEMVNKIFDVGHESILEHVSFFFAVSGVSRVLTHQLVRHRIATYHQRSQRYVNEESADVVIPPSILNNPLAEELFDEIKREVDDAYSELVALGVPKEDARYVLMNATESQLVVTMNARNLIHFFGLRCCSRAQWEIRQMADLMLQATREVLPAVFDKVGPNCYTTGHCPEGKMCCGMMDNMNKKYSAVPFVPKIVGEINGKG